jgi:hypothetical protein
VPSPQLCQEQNYIFDSSVSYGPSHICRTIYVDSSVSPAPLHRQSPSSSRPMLLPAPHHAPSQQMPISTFSGRCRCPSRCRAPPLPVAANTAATASCRRRCCHCQRRCHRRSHRVAANAAATAHCRCPLPQMQPPMPFHTFSTMWAAAQEQFASATPPLSTQCVRFLICCNRRMPMLPSGNQGRKRGDDEGRYTR